ncbi:DUF4920 domain-containing protein [Gramella jeungdoensis]|uniref:DUF4920 domain-containing protein n=1 Tax=Gramella jeungdoensis TaxID=708091 RepID=A0ABT0Z0A2_9FLAO|nr:DUF4920 domain-containing protein [Gramella jeungdoensis]MCM8569148.1 DUF4920 domain-containing protein [Gramella jeungdoensis]
MRTSVLLLVLFLAFISCKEKAPDKNSELTLLQTDQQEYESFGEKISANNSLSAQAMKLQYEKLELGDTISVKFTAKVNSVCKMKRCWMKLELPETEEDPMVKFREYGFFVPKDIEGKEVVVEGIAFIEEISVEDQEHFAKDAGKAVEEIEAIVEPKRSLGFLAHGVLVKK